MDDQVVSGSDINWASSERPVVSGLCAVIGVAVGYVVGLEGLLWWAGSPLTPVREIPVWIWHILRTYGPLPPVVGGWIPAALAVALGGGFGVGGWILATRDNVRHIRGMQIHTSARRAARSFRPFQGKLRGVPIHPVVEIGEHQECRHIFVLGGAGAGKTTILWPLLRAIIARGDKILLLDFKGDFTKGLPRPFCLLSPADARSARWLIGRDIRTRLDAMAFAETLIPLPAGGDVIWARGAQGLLIALVAHLQTTNGPNWGFSDLAQLAGKVMLDYKLLVSIVVKEHPPAKGFLMGEDSRTTQSFLAELSGALGHAIELGVADYTILKTKKKEKITNWSIRDWLDPKSKLPKVAVIGWDTDSTELSRAWSATLIEQMVRQVGRMPDVPPDKRRIWLFLDEVAQAGKIPSITTSLVTLRSKGARTLLAMQSIAQPNQSYDQHTLTIWAGSCATKILCSLGSEADQKFGSGMLGEREVERYTTQTTQSPGMSGPSRSGSWQRVREPVLLPSELGYRLTPDADGVKSLILSAGRDTAALLRWPFYQVPNLRKDRIEAAWKAVDFKRPRWGEDPLPVADVPKDDSERLDPMVHPNPDITAIQKKAGPDREPETEKPKAQAKPSHMKVAIPTGAATKTSKDKQIDADPFADIAAGVLADALLPGASVITDLINTVVPDSTDASIDLPSVPGIPEPEPAADDGIGSGREPEAGD